MTIAILVILVLFGWRIIHRLDVLIWVATDGQYKPWYWSIKDYLFNNDPIFRR